MTALAIDQAGVAGLLAHVARLTAEIPTKGIEQLDELVDQAREANTIAHALERCGTAIGDAKAARARLKTFEIAATRRAGELLGSLEAGKKGPKKSERREAAEAAGLSPQDAARAVDLASLDEAEVEKISAHLEAKGRIPTVRGILDAARSPSLNPSYDGDEWYTPAEFMHRVRGALGGIIDCDLTSCLLAQRQVQARAWWSLRSPMDPGEIAKVKAAGMTDEQIRDAQAAWRGIGGVESTPLGQRLTQVPSGTVFGQPPYSCPAATCDTIMDGRRLRRVEAAVILVNVATASAVQQRLLRASSARLWVGKGAENPKARMAFMGPDGKIAASNRYDQVAYYLGDNPSLFAAEFAGWGTVKVDG